MDTAQPPTRAPRRRRSVQLLGLATGAGLAVAGVAAYLLVSASDNAERAPDAAAVEPAQSVPPIVSPEELERRDGIRVLRVALTGADGLVDVRYQVVDADKAASVHESAPVLVDEQTGVVVDQLFMGHSHTGPLHAGETYFLLFENPGNLVARGSAVTVALGVVFSISISA